MVMNIQYTLKEPKPIKLPAFNPGDVILVHNIDLCDWDNPHGRMLYYIVKDDKTGNLRVIEMDTDILIDFVDFMDFLSLDCITSIEIVKSKIVVEATNEND
jgi:hypothetical protein